MEVGGVSHFLPDSSQGLWSHLFKEYVKSFPWLAIWCQRLTRERTIPPTPNFQEVISN